MSDTVRKLATIVALDVAGYSRRSGDQGTRNEFVRDF